MAMAPLASEPVRVELFGLGLWQTDLLLSFLVLVHRDLGCHGSLQTPQKLGHYRVRSRRPT